MLPLQNLYSTYSLTPYNFLIPPTQNIITFGIYKIPLVRKSLVISYFYIFGSPCAMNWIFNLAFMHFLSISPPTRGVGGPNFFGIKSEFDQCTGDTHLLTWVAIVCNIPVSKFSISWRKCEFAQISFTRVNFKLYLLARPRLFSDIKIKKWKFRFSGNKVWNFPMATKGRGRTYSQLYPVPIFVQFVKKSKINWTSAFLISTWIAPMGFVLWVFPTRCCHC